MRIIESVYPYLPEEFKTPFMEDLEDINNKLFMRLYKGIFGMADSIEECEMCKAYCRWMSSRYISGTSRLPGGTR